MTAVGDVPMRLVDLKPGRPRDLLGYRLHAGARDRIVACHAGHPDADDADRIGRVTGGNAPGSLKAVSESRSVSSSGGGCR